MRYDNINLAGLPFPPVIEALDFEVLRAAYIARLKAVLDARGIDYDVDTIEADPGVALAETTGYRELVVRGRVNDGARAVMLAFASGADLDNLAAFYATARLAGEADAAFRERVQLAPEALSVAGPPGAYAYHARKVSPEIVDVAVYSPRRGQVVVVPLVATGNGVPPPAIIDAVWAALSAENIKPLTDELAVMAPVVVPITIAGTLIVDRGPDRAVVKAAALASLAGYLAGRRRIGRTVYRAGIAAALQVAGVENVILASPAEDAVPPPGGIVVPAIGAVLAT